MYCTINTVAGKDSLVMYCSQNSKRSTEVSIQDLPRSHTLVVNPPKSGSPVLWSWLAGYQLA
jgi:hypothetical protein